MEERPDGRLAVELEDDPDGWDRVGGVIARKTPGLVETKSSGGLNVSAFERALDAIATKNWRPKYFYVRPWENDEVRAAVDNLIADPLVKVIVVTGTTLGEKVRAMRNA